MADFEALSVETVSIRGGAHYLNRTKFWIAESPWRSRDNTGYQKEPHYQFIRVWYNSLLARNRTERAMSMLRNATQEQELRVGEVEEPEKTAEQTAEEHEQQQKELTDVAERNKKIAKALALFFLVVFIAVIILGRLRRTCAWQHAGTV